MLNLTRPNFDKVRSVLLRQQKQVEEEIKDISRDDPITMDGLLESSEPGTASWMEEVHSKSVAAKENLTVILGKIQNALFRLSKGDYGKCERCGKMIETERLKAIPTATVCIACSKKTR